MRGVGKFLQDTTGASAAEYGLILGIIIVVGATGIMALGPGVGTLYDDAETTVAQHANALVDVNDPDAELEAPED